MVGSRDWVVKGALAQKVEKWKAEEVAEQEEERRCLRATHWVDDNSMEVDGEESATEGCESEESEDDEMDTNEVKALKARRRYLRALLQSGPSKSQPSSSPRCRACPHSTHQKQVDPREIAFNIVPSYTVLVINTNILLSSLSMFATLVTALDSSRPAPCHHGAGQAVVRNSDCTRAGCNVSAHVHLDACAHPPAIAQGVDKQRKLPTHA